MRPVRVEVLGRVRAWRDGQELSLGPPRQRAVLAVLALRANHVVSRDEIVDAVWGDRPPASAVNGVHLYVSALRRVLADERPGRLLAGSGPGYLLRLEPDQLDLAVAGGYLDRARRLVAAGDAAGAVREFDAALGLWHGTPLAGIAGPFAEVERTRLTELRLTAVEDRAEAVLDLGRHRELVPELSTLAAEHPLRERMRAVLMTALYRSGRRSEALTVYAETRRHLVDELGVEPGRQLRDLHRKMLTDEDAGTMVAGDPPPVAVPRQLPAAVRHFAGRADELAVLSRVADEAGAGPVLISAIEGTAGVGKTALAVYWAHQVAHRYPDGQLYVNLRGFDPGGPPATPGEAVRGLLDALAVPRHRIPLDLPAQSALYRSLLSGRRVLVLLDNARDAEQVLPLLPGSASCLVVVTSRNDLSGLVATTGAHLLTLDVLSAAGSRDLLTRRLGADRVGAEPRAVDDIIAACARLPLALAIAAARAAKHQAFPLSVLAAELSVADNGLDAFAGPDPRNDIRAVFSWSYRSLSTPAARLFRLLGLPPGADLGAPAAASLAGVPVREVRPLLAELARAYLVTEHSPGRYLCHDLLRAYARELAGEVDSGPDRRAAVHRLLDYHLYATWAADRALDPDRRPIDFARPVPGVTLEEPAHDHALAWLDAERANLCAAVDHAAAHGFDTHAWQLAWALAAYLDRQGHWGEWVAAQRVAVAAAERLRDPVAQSSAHDSLACALMQVGDQDGSRAHFQRALELSVRSGDRLSQGVTLMNLGVMQAMQGNHGAALRRIQEALQAYRAGSSQRGEADAFNAIGWLHAQAGDHDKALNSCQRALRLHEELGNRHGQANAWDSIGYVRRRRGEAEEASACYQRAIDLYRDLGDRHQEAASLDRLGDARDAAGDADTARNAWHGAVAILDDMGHPDAGRIRGKLRKENAQAS